jgi:hypothetical protein
MPQFVFWNTYRLGGGSGANKKMIIEGVLAQIFNDYPNVEFAALCEVTGDVQLGDAPVGKNLYKASKKFGQLAYSAFDTDLNNLDLESAEIADFRDVFGSSPYKKGGGQFSKQSKRPVAYVSYSGNRHVYIYHANATAKASFLTAWVSESLNQETGGAFILAGDLNCEPPQFNTSIDLCTDVPGYYANFSTPNNGHTHNAKTGLAHTYDWAVAGTTGNVVTVTKIDFTAVINGMGFQDDPRSDHLPIVVSL